MYEFTIFKDLYDNKTHRKMSWKTWEEFTGFLEKLSKQPLEGKHDAVLISPAIYKEGTTRSNKNLEYWGGWCCLDVDDVDFTMETLENDLSNICSNNRYFCYSTASSKTDKPKFRVVFDVGESVPRSKTKHLWYAIQREFKGIGDEQTKDGSRMYYIPAKYAGADNFIIRGDGDPLDCNALLEKHPFKEPTGNSFLDKLPEDMQKQVVEYRKSKLTNTKYRWASYRDCPFFPKKLSRDYLQISDGGWYHTMYKIMVATACNALKKGYPITANEITDLCKQFDQDTGNWYEKRPMHVEANSALEYAYRNTPLDI